MDYSLLVEQINNNQNHNCFKTPDKTELDYLTSLDLPDEVFNFYSRHALLDIIEINNIRLLPISVITEENTNYTPGYILAPFGFCVIASTIEGDVYCIRKTIKDYFIVIASHDEIYEGQNVEEIMKATKEVAKTFPDFLNAFIRKKLVVSFYDIEK